MYQWIGRIGKRMKKRRFPRARAPGLATYLALTTARQGMRLQDRIDESILPTSQPAGSRVILVRWSSELRKDHLSLNSLRPPPGRSLRPKPGQRPKVFP